MQKISQRTFTPDYGASRSINSRGRAWSYGRAAEIGVVDHDAFALGVCSPYKQADECASSSRASARDDIYHLSLIHI